MGREIKMESERCSHPDSGRQGVRRREHVKWWLSTVNQSNEHTDHQVATQV